MAITAAAVCLSIQGRASNLVVTSVADSGPGTLRDALAQAQNGDVVTFAVTGVISNSSGELVISSDINIQGPGTNVLAVAGTNWGPRVFQVGGGVTANISGLMIRDTYAGLSYTGGAISNGGNLTISNCVFVNCKSQFGGSAADPAPGGIAGGSGYDGGAIYNSGALVLVDCDFLGNIASAGGNGLAGPRGTGGNGGNGGAIYTTGTLVATNCNFLTNSAGDGGAGGSGYFDGPLGGSPHGSPGGNGGLGGAIYATGPVTFVNCTFGFNHAGSGGSAGSGLGASSTQRTPGNGGPGANGGNGGAIFSLGQLTLITCTVANNHAGSGSSGGAAGGGYYAPGGYGGYGGIGGNGTVYCTGSAQLTACTFIQNAAGSGGHGGTGGAGGTGAPGGVGGYGGAGGSGGSVYANNSTPLITLQSTLVTQDVAGSGGAGGAGGANGYGTGTGPTGASGSAGTGANLFGPFQSLSHNFVRLSAGNTGFTNGIKGDIVDTNAQLFLGPLFGNGGRTLTCALQSGASPIVEKGDDTITGAPLNIMKDQRGYPRLSGAHVDIGACEFLLPTLPMTLSGSISNGSLVLTVTNVPGMRPPVIFTSSKATGPWIMGPPIPEVAPGVYQGHINPYRSQYFLRVRTP